MYNIYILAKIFAFETEKETPLREKVESRSILTMIEDVAIKITVFLRYQFDIIFSGNIYIYIYINIRVHSGEMLYFLSRRGKSRKKKIGYPSAIIFFRIDKR